MLENDEFTKLFNAKTRESFVKPLVKQPYTGVNEEALNFQNFVLNAELLQQHRFERLENQDFRDTVRTQSYFDAGVGILFLIIVLHRLVMTAWGYFTEHCERKLKDKKVRKKKEEAAIMMDTMVDIAESKLREYE